MIKRSAHSILRVRAAKPALSFRAVNRRGTRGFQAGLQRHHLLPRQLLKQNCFGRMFDNIGRQAIGFEDFRVNGLLLPSRESTSIRTGLPLHRGPHRFYNEMVIARVGRIESAWSRTRHLHPEEADETALFRLALVQKSLRKTLLNQPRRVLLNRKDPVGTGFDFTDLDAMADTLWNAV
ncbi:MAG: AHH domain-containing protein [Erythrobacter sp.]